MLTLSAMPFYGFLFLFFFLLNFVVSKIFLSLSPAPAVAPHALTLWSLLLLLLLHILPAPSSSSFPPFPHYSPPSRPSFPLSSSSASSSSNAPRQRPSLWTPPWARENYGHTSKPLHAHREPMRGLKAIRSAQPKTV